jgi:hypothetical protein
MHDGFGVGMGRETMAALYQVVVQFDVVVNLAIQHHPDATVFVRKGLVTACYVNDAETPESQADARTDEDTFIVWAAMHDSLGHAVYELAGNFALLVEFKYSANAAHFLCPFTERAL